jgi:hypothetical protein
MVVILADEAVSRYVELCVCIRGATGLYPDPVESSPDH